MPAASARASHASVHGAGAASLSQHVRDGCQTGTQGLRESHGGCRAALIRRSLAAASTALQEEHHRQAESALPATTNRAIK
eukprot:6195521-Pleurochrysis_carterae.AAC.1